MTFSSATQVYLYNPIKVLIGLNSSIMHCYINHQNFPKCRTISSFSLQILIDWADAGWNMNVKPQFANSTTEPPMQSCDNEVGIRVLHHKGLYG